MLWMFWQFTVDCEKKKITHRVNIDHVAAEFYLLLFYRFPAEASTRVVLHYFYLRVLTSEHYMSVYCGFGKKGGKSRTYGMGSWCDSPLRTGWLRLQPMHSCYWCHWLGQQSGRYQCRWWPGSHQSRPQSVRWWSHCEEERNQKVEFTQCHSRLLSVFCMW